MLIDEPSAESKWFLNWLEELLDTEEKGMLARLIARFGVDVAAN